MNQQANEAFPQASVRVKSLSLAVLTALAFTAAGPAWAQAELNTRDVNPVHPLCSPVSFIVSLNDDDDNANRRDDYREAALPTQEDNLREFTFKLPGAAKVFIGEPVLVKGGTTAVGLGRRVRAYTAARQPFIFNQVYNTPVTFYMEGVKRSKNRQDFAFEYDYRNAADQHICGPGAQGTVVKAEATFSVKSGSGTNFNTNKKMLITGTGKAKSKWKPAGYTPTWSFDGTAVLATPNQKDTRFTAGTVITPAAGLNSEELTATVQEAGLWIEAHVPVNITAPVHAQEYRGWINGQAIDSPSATQWHDANRGRFSLFNTRIDYHLQDQFRQRIKTSAWAGRRVQVRENIGNVMVSPIATVQNWINTRLRWTAQWRNKSNGQINDRLRVQSAPKSIIIRRPGGGAAVFVAGLQVAGGIMMNLGANTTSGKHRLTGNFRQW